MSISGVSGSGGAGQSASLNKQEVPNGAQEFMAYMKETPAQRLEDSWLTAHGITRQQFDAMSGAEKAKIIKQMEADIQQEIKQAAQNKTKSPIPLG